MGGDELILVITGLLRAVQLKRSCIHLLWCLVVELSCFPDFLPAHLLPTGVIDFLSQIIRASLQVATMSSSDKILLPDFLKQLTSNKIPHSKAIHAASKMSVLASRITDRLAGKLTNGEDTKPITHQSHWLD